MNKIVVIGNPIAGGGAARKIHRAVSILKSSGLDVDLRLTSRKRDAECFAREASLSSDTLVIAAGGDGTYNEVANGLLGSNAPLAILPLGTTSVLARELAIPPNIDKAVEIALTGKLETVHAGKISFNPSPLTVSGHDVCDATQDLATTRHFLLMAGIGFDGDAVYGVNETVKKYSGKIAYIASGLRSIIKYHPGALSINAAVRGPADFGEGRFRLHRQYSSLEDNILSSTGYTVIVSKAACYGGDMKITPDARLTSPYLYVFIGHKKGKLDLIRYLAAIISGRTLSLKEISYFRTDRITIRGSSHIQLDGDYAGRAPAEIGVVHNALKLVVPHNYSG